MISLNADISTKRSDIKYLSEKSLFDFSLCLGRIPGGIISKGNNIITSYTGKNLFNRAFQVNCTEENLDIVILRVNKFFFDMDSAYSWIISPSDLPPDYSSRLIKQGLKLNDQLSGFEYHLQNLIFNNENCLGFRYDVLDNRNRINHWAQIVSIAYNLKERDSSDFFKIVLGLYDIMIDNFEFYFAWYNNQPVGAALIYRKDQISGLYFLAVLPEYQNKHISSCLVDKIMQAEKAKGMEYFIVHANTKLAQLFLKKGFAPACDFEIYSMG